MAGESKIEWCDATWNPIRGCSRVSQGCVNWYAERTAAHPRLSGPGKPYEGLAVMTSAGPLWSGKIQLVEELLDWPLHWRGAKRARAEGRPSRIFVNSMSDLFHESVPDEWIDRIFAMMALAPQHTFQVLTKRPSRAQRWFETTASEWTTKNGAKEPGFRRDDVTTAAFLMFEAKEKFTDEQLMIQEEDWPLPNVWLGVSVEDQATADERIPLLLQTPAALRWISAEPLLGGINLMDTAGDPLGDDGGDFCATLDWVVVGGESGPGARPMHPDWVRSLLKQCQLAEVPFFFKQWGEWAPLQYANKRGEPYLCISLPSQHNYKKSNREIVWHPVRDESSLNLKRVGKKAAGRLLHGREWNEFPEVRA